MIAEPEGYAEERSRRIEQTVARDLARRRRLIRVYLALLIVPLAVAAAHMLLGRTDREVVEQEVEQQVKPVQETYRQIEPMLAKVRDVGALLPEIRAADARIQTFERGQSDLEQQVSAVAAELGALKPAVADAREAKEEVTELRRAYDLQQQQLRQRIDAFELWLGPAAGEAGTGRRPPPAYPSGTTPAADVEALSQRVKDLEATVETLQRELRRLQAELRRLQPPR